jgi:uncharacterized membrane protein YeiH
MTYLKHCNTQHVLRPVVPCYFAAHLYAKTALLGAWLSRIATWIATMSCTGWLMVGFAALVTRLRPTVLRTCWLWQS